MSMFMPMPTTISQTVDHWGSRPSRMDRMAPFGSPASAVIFQWLTPRAAIPASTSARSFTSAGWLVLAPFLIEKLLQKKLDCVCHL